MKTDTNSEPVVEALTPDEHNEATKFIEVVSQPRRPVLPTILAAAGMLGMGAMTPPAREPYVETEFDLARISEAKAKRERRALKEKPTNLT